MHAVPIIAEFPAPLDRVQLAWRIVCCAFRSARADVCRFGWSCRRPVWLVGAHADVQSLHSTCLRSHPCHGLIMVGWSRLPSQFACYLSAVFMSAARALFSR